VIPELRYAQTKTHEEDLSGLPWNVIDAKYVPKSGYFKIYRDEDLVLNFIPYRTEV
jgi:hypothetical protein